MSINEDYLKPRLDVIRKTALFEENEISTFENFLIDSPEEELFRISPLRYAKNHNMDEQKAIDLFLQAAHVKIMEFNWGILCPSCGAFLSTDSGLRWLNDTQDCTLCMIPSIEPSLAENVEIAFTVSPSVRFIRFHDLENLDFEHDGLHMLFSTSISLYPEIHKMIHNAIFQSHRIDVGETVELDMDFEQTHYFIMVPQTHCVAHIEIDPDKLAEDVELEIVNEGFILPEYNVIGPGKGKFTIHNRGKNKLIVGMLKDPHLKPVSMEERPTPIPPLFTVTPFLSAKRLMTNQTFRDLFRTDSIPLASGMQFKDITILFTDLKDSTSMYDEIGDMNAYALVRDHFNLLRGIVAANGGAIIKTMGDAIMASFAEPADALRAANTMHKQMKSLSSTKKAKLKIGIHMGACIAVEQNNQLDYFGQTINVAARVQNLADAEETLITKPIYEAEDVEKTIAKLRLKKMEDKVSLKGVKDTVELYRLVM